MVRYLLYFTVLALLITERADAARILAIFPFPVKSHFISFTPLLDELANRGHQMTVLSAFPRKSPLKNYEDIAFENHLTGKDGPQVNMFETHNLHVILFSLVIRTLSVDFCEKFLNQPSVQDLIHSTNKEFDLIIYEPFLAECSYGFIHKFNVPFIHISSNTIAKWMGDGVGNPFFYSYIPDLRQDVTDHMSFTERLMNSLALTILDVERYWISVPRMESLMRKYFNDTTIPSVHELETNVSFLLLNRNLALNFPRPLTPNTAEVGGMHLKEPKTLPQDLQKFIDDATDGVIYFSFGSNVRSTDMPDEIRQHFLNAFSKLKQKVLWKWEADTLPGQPKNVHLSKWFPQSDILAHPNVKAFITHGGLLSIQEATFLGIPLIAIPFVADQKQNARKAAAEGYAVVLEVKNLTETALDWAFHEILSNSRYRENAKRVSSIFRDQPQKPLDRAVFWTEYVIRHKGAPHMRSAALKLNFFQYYLLDVIAVILVVVVVCLVVSVKIIRLLFRRKSSKSRQTKTNTPEKKVN